MEENKAVQFEEKLAGEKVYKGLNAEAYKNKLLEHSYFEEAVAFEEVINLAKMVEAAGGRALLVGGSVRDEVAEKYSKDFDVEVYGLSPERIKTLLLAVEQTPKGPVVYLSRSHPRLVAKLFEIEVPEIPSGVVQIKNIARQAGSRTKIAVISNQEGIDPVGSCVGQKGVRVTTVISELGGEKIDIVPWSEGKEKFIASSVSPAKVLEVDIDKERKQAKVTVAEDQLSLAIGKGGQNVRLAAKLTGYKIDIRSRSGETVAEATSEGEVSGEGIAAE